MAEMYGRLTGKPGVVMGQGIFLACNALFGTLEAVKGASPMLLLGDFTDMAPFMHHAPYQAGTGEHGNHDLRNLLASATKYTAAVSEPKQAVQTIQLAIKHATTGTPGPVAVIFASRSLAGTVKTRRPPRLHATERHLAHGTARPAAGRRGARRRRAPRRVEPGDPRRQRRPRLARAGPSWPSWPSSWRFPWPRRPRARAPWPRCIRSRSASSATGARPWPTRWSRPPTPCSSSARAWRPTDTCFENPELLDADRQTFLQIDVEPLNVGRHFPVAAAIVADARDALAALVAELRPRLTAARARGRRAGGASTWPS